MSNSVLNYDEFERKRNALLKRLSREAKEELEVQKVVDLESTMQHYSDKYNAVITVVLSDGSKHMVFTPSEPIKLSDVIMPREFLEEGE